jgi:hypothetical protein
MKTPLILFSIIILLPSVYAQTCVKYNRSSYQHWIDSDRDCQNTRNEVLIAESTVPVKFKTGSKCRVLSGKWIDPYTGLTFTNPRKLDIDHLIPLKEAHDSGAWQWSSAKRRRFANSLKNENHLIAVQASANRRKGARDVAEWLPPNIQYRKEYARIWTKIKVDWGLTADKSELNALKRILGDKTIKYPDLKEEYQCQNNPFSAPASVVQTKIKKSNSGICHDTSSRWYKRTKRFTAFDSLKACIESGGRLPK